MVLYAAENLTDAELDQFTVMAFVFKPDGTLTARQVAPGRRTLAPREVKYSTLVLDGGAVDATDVIVIGINQAQRAGIRLVVAGRAPAGRRGSRAAQEEVASG